MNPGVTVQGFTSMQQLTIEIIIYILLRASWGKGEAVLFEQIEPNGLSVVLYMVPGGLVTHTDSSQDTEWHM